MRRSKLGWVSCLVAAAWIAAPGPGVSAQELKGFDALAAIDGTSVCQLTDSFGYVWNLEVDELGDATGTVENAFPGGALASGTVAAGFIELTATNQAPDGCSVFHDFFQVLAFCQGDDCAGVVEAHCIDEFLYSVYWEGTFTSPCVSTLIFADGFETGDMSRWSSTVP